MPNCAALDLNNWCAVNWCAVLAGQYDVIYTVDVVGSPATDSAGDGTPISEPHSESRLDGQRLGHHAEEGWMQRGGYPNHHARNDLLKKAKPPPLEQEARP
jgi:hypothetical protein